MATTVFEAGYTDDNAFVHAARRALGGWRCLCGRLPARVIGRFDSDDESACPDCVEKVRVEVPGQ